MLKRILFSLCICSNVVLAQNKQELIRQNNIQKSWVKNLPFTSIAFPQGSAEIVQVSKNPKNAFEMYIATASSGVWYSNNNGTSFIPVFTDQMPQNVETISVDWGTKTIWVATTEGLFYKENTSDWQRVHSLSLENISKILILSPTEICVSSFGTALGEKGIFRTEDKGKTWKQTFGQVAVTDLVQAPDNPKTLFISTWDFEKTNTNIIPFGSKSGIYKSTDGGISWVSLTEENTGFAQRNVGKISLAVFSQNSIYAVVDNNSRLEEDDLSFEKMSANEFLNLDNEKLNFYLYNHSLQDRYSVANLREIVRSGIAPSSLTKYLGSLPRVVGAEIFHSVDGGKKWNKKTTKPLTNVFYNKGYEVSALAVNPKNEKEIYLSGVPLLVSPDGGTTWNLLKDNNLKNKVYQLSVDDKQIIYVNDKGFFQSFDQGRTWNLQNIPQTIQVKSLSLGNPATENLFASVNNQGIWKYSGTKWQQLSQENGKLVVNSDGKCYIGQSFGQILPLGQPKIVLPNDKTIKQRYPKETTLFISPQNNSIIYAGSNLLFQSLNEGKVWNSISNDLSNGNKSGNLSYGTISAITESPFQFGLLYAGSDDGMIHTSTNGGVSWQMVYSSFPQPNKVVCLQASVHNKNRVYAVLKSSNNQTLVFSSDNNGKSWDNLKSNLPDENVNVILEDPYNEQVLYLGTQSGLYVSFDGGEFWHIFQKNLPKTSVNQIVINPQTQKIYIGTDGRGIFSADISALKELRAAVQDQLFYPLLEKYTIPFSPKWGNATSAWQKPELPNIYFSAFASQGGTEVKVSIIKDKVVLNSFKIKTEAGFNYLPYNLSFSNEGRVEYEKKIQKYLKPASNGVYYLQKGMYRVVFEGDMIDEERILEVQ
ncbi:MAG: hypothetical protein Q3983_08445 [Capnocytophaga sp.]|nr:hypothetical protein [Capnocytophaga sp.]